MITVLTVMSDMDFSHDLLGMVGLDLSGLSLVVLARGMQQVQSLCAWFSYRWDACERGSVLAICGIPVSICRFLATGVTPVSLWPLITMGNLGASSCLDVV
jgi:hypothetical protein